MTGKPQPLSDLARYEHKSILIVQVVWPGDPSVGIPERHIYIREMDGSPVLDARCLDIKDVDPAIDEFRTKIADAFEIVGDGRPSVVFHYD